jgi:hypothetical protein
MRIGVHIAAMLIGLTSFTNLALAQPKLPSPIFEEGKTLTEADKESREKHRMLLVYYEGTDPVDQAEFERRTLKNPTLWAFARWHCVAIKIPAPPRAKASFTGRGRGPTVKVFIDGQCMATVGTQAVKMPEFILPGGQPTNNFIRARMIPSPLRILYQADFAKDRYSATDPIWKMQHERKCPMPEAPPEPEPLYNTRDDLAPVVRDPAIEEKIGMLDRLDEARRLVKHGDLYQATGVYTWLWERAAQLDPAFRPARMSVLAEEMAALAWKRPGSRERFTKLRDVRGERLLWADYGQMHEWMVLNAACTDAGSTVDFLDYFTSEDEGSMCPPADAMVYKFLMRRESYDKAWELPKNPAARVRAIADRQNPRFPSTATEENREDYRVFARQFLLDEGSRLYAACLVKGDEISAQQIAEMVIKARDDAAARRSLVITALSADPPQARAIHNLWLDQAQTLDGDARPDLRNRITLGVKPALEK